MAEEHQVKNTSIVSILESIDKQFPKDGPSRFIAVYLGVGLIISFLFLASLAPQIGEKLGNLSVKKTSQQSQAAITNLSFNSNPITSPAAPLAPGTIVTLRWSISRTQSGSPYYASCQGKPAGSTWSGYKNVSLLSGTSIVQPTQTTTYILECIRRETPGIDRKEVTVHIASAGAVNLLDN